MRKTKNKKKLIVVSIVMALIICAAVVAGITFSKPETDLEIQTTYLTLQYPKEYKEYLTYEETVVGQNSEVVFFMNYHEEKMELFRLRVCMEAPEVYEGFLKTNNGDMYVALTGFQMDQNAFVTENEAGEPEINAEMEALYFAMKDGMTMVMNSIEQAPGYSTVMGVFEVDKMDEALSHWTVSLPSNITWEEKNEGEIYRAVFYGNVGDKKIPLYTVSLGDTTADSPIGQFSVNGEMKIVSVDVNNFDAAEEFTEDELAVVYVLMDTVNDVLTAIRESDNFVDHLEPVA